MKGIIKLSICFLTFLLFCSIVAASIWIYSNIVTVEVKTPTLKLEVSPAAIFTGQEIIFKGNLTQETTPITNKTVYVFMCNQTGSIITIIGSNQTDENGVFIYRWKATLPAGTYYFKAGCEMP